MVDKEALNEQLCKLKQKIQEARPTPEPDPAASGAAVAAWRLTPVIAPSTSRNLSSNPGPFCVSDGGRQVALITKKWSGLFQEAFSRVDSFG